MKYSASLKIFNQHFLNKNRDGEFGDEEWEHKEQDMNGDMENRNVGMGGECGGGVYGEGAGIWAGAGAG
jgi:hypothetical protein